MTVAQREATQDKALWGRRNHTTRCREDDWRAFEEDTRRLKAADSSMDTTRWLTQAGQVRAGYLRCYLCDHRDPASPRVPVEWGNLTGKSLSDWIVRADEVIAAQHPAHAPVLIGLIGLNLDEPAMQQITQARRDAEQARQDAEKNRVALKARLRAQIAAAEKVEKALAEALAAKETAEQETAAAQARAAEAERAARERPEPPAHVPAQARKTPRQRKEAPVPAAARSAPDASRTATIERPRDRIEDIAPGTVPQAVFAPGLESGPEDCLHPQVRVKGVCPDCGEWVGSKR